MNSNDTRKEIRKLGWLLALALVAFAALSIGEAPHPADAEPTENAVLDWNRHAIEALVNASGALTPGAGQTPPVSVLHLAMVQAAVYDAVNLIDGGHEAYLADLPGAPSSASKSAAVATAAHHVLVGVEVVPPLLPEVVDRLDGLYEDSLDAATTEDGAEAVASGIAAGEAATGGRPRLRPQPRRPHVAHADLADAIPLGAPFTSSIHGVKEVP